MNTPSSAAAVAAKSAVTMRKLASQCQILRDENADLRAKVASYEKADRVRAIVDAMEDKGINAEMSRQEKTASLMEEEDLAAVERALNFTTGGIKLASVTADDDVLGRRSSATEGFHNFCRTGARS